MKYTLPLLTVFILLSCSSDPKQEAFCDCMKAGDALNQLQAEAIASEDRASYSKRLKQLRDKKTESCKDFEMIDGKSAFELKQNCD